MNSLSWFPRVTLLGLGLLAALALPERLFAQRSLPANSDAAALAVDSTVPMTSAARVSAAIPRIVPSGITRVALDVAAVPAAPAPVTRANTSLLVVGAAALVVGLMIGGDGGTIMALAGGVIGLVGLFRLMQ